MTDYTIAVVQDAVKVLDAFSKDQKGLKLTEIVRRTSLGKNKVFRILYTLEQSRMVHRDSNYKFHLGFHVAELAQSVHQHHLIRDLCEPIMEELLEDTQESIFLGVASGHNALCIAALESTRSMRLYAQVGVQSPLYMGGVPKVLLAYMHPPERERHIEYFQKTVRDEIVDWAELRRKLDTIREQGCSITVDELDLGARSVTAPVFDASAQVVAAMSIAGPSIRFGADAISRYTRLVTEATLGISATLGYNPECQTAAIPDKEFLSDHL